MGLEISSFPEGNFLARGDDPSLSVFAEHLYAATAPE